MVRGLLGLKRKLRKLPQETRRILQADLELIGRELNVDQRSLVAKGDGVLAGTIRTHPLPGNQIGAAVRAGGAATTKPVINGADSSYDYAMAQELGTEDMPPNPFFYGPYRQSKRRIKRRITTALKKVARSL